MPDFIPVLGYLDDLVLVPAGLALAVRLVPPDVMAASRTAAQQTPERLASSRAAGAVIVAVWLAAATLLASVLLGSMS
jgi:uncharacterized membrane protein YkvA (DUF1232 family)